MPGMQDIISDMLTRMTGTKADIRQLKPVGGGCINDAQKAKTGTGTFFIKSNSASEYPGMLSAEARGLELLRTAGAIHVPEVIGLHTAEGRDYLVLEWLEPARRSKDFFQAFGHGLATQHRCTHETFGLDHDNYIGSLPQCNESLNDGIRFLVEERIRKQALLALAGSRLDASLMKRIDKLIDRLPGLVPGESPALLHGDLWSGNFMTGPDGAAWLIDPAVYYGFRETDIAMTLLFGGFDDPFYNGYNEAFPLLPGWKERVGIHQLYPLLVHVNLFGGGYAGQVSAVLDGYA